ncbi:MAG: hypothetical protein MH825_12995 [Cyanobacteria bacterium]|nr:hypothetical protein [Cyanobacteriota bacterium]
MDDLQDYQAYFDRRRPWHIVDSYRLFGEEGDDCRPLLQAWLETMPPPLVELALVETLVAAWRTLPLPRGRVFVRQAQDWLEDWLAGRRVISIQPGQFRAVTGLDPEPVTRAVARARLARSQRPAFPQTNPGLDGSGFGGPGG